MKHLRTEGPTPCVIHHTTTALQVSESTLQKAERNSNLFFLKGKNFNIASHVASSKHKHISQKYKGIRN